MYPSATPPIVDQPCMERQMNSLSRRKAIHSIAILAASWTFASAFHSAAAEAIPLAIKGYDPVAYFTVGKAVPGLPDIEYEWDEHRYRFSSAANRELFAADPVRYAPQFGNYCAMALSKGEIVIADPENWLISDGKLYVFGKAMGPGLFQQSLAENVAKANKNRTILPGH